jgi:hypothetical protein
LAVPGFLIVGAPKCGTSWLHATLGQHPHIIVVPEEVEYFSSRFDERSAEWYLGLFDEQERAVAERKAAPYVFGEKSARYCSLPRDRIRAVHALLPNVRLVLMTRDPVARHWSHARRYFSKPRVAEREGGDALSVPRERLFDLFTKIRRLGDFSAMIDGWTSIYPAERLLVVSQEHALANPRAAFDAVLRHVGVPTSYDPAAIPLLFRRRNCGATTSMPDDVAGFLGAMYAREREYLSTLFSNGGVVVAPPPQEPQPGFAFIDKTVVFTGRFERLSRAEAERLVQREGGSTRGSIQAGVDVVVAGMDAGSKFKRAAALGIPVWDEATFLASLTRGTR